MVEENDVFQLHGVADDAVGADERAGADECAVAHLGLRADDARRAEIGRGKDLRGLMHPDVLGDFLVILAQRRSQLEDEILDALQRLPGIGELREIILCQRMVEIIEVCDRIHYRRSFFSMSRKYL